MRHDILNCSSFFHILRKRKRKRVREADTKRQRLACCVCLLIAFKLEKNNWEKFPADRST